MWPVGTFDVVVRILKLCVEWGSTNTGWPNVHHVKNLHTHEV